MNAYIAIIADVMHAAGITYLMLYWLRKLLVTDDGSARP
jgi:hypothetical protein